MTATWSVVVPVKGTPDSKSRLAPDRTPEQRAALALAFTTDAVDALLAAPSVLEVVVVAPVGEVADALGRRGARVRVIADPGDGLNAAVRAGLAAARGSSVAAMLGDLPALTAEDVEAALAAASAHPLAFVADAGGTGTTLLTATPPAVLTPRFGADSATRHAAAGHVELGAAAGPRLRHDVDTEADLAAALLLGVGPATAAALSLRPGP